MSSSDARTARSASALARKNRVRWNSVAPIAEKKTKRLDPRGLRGPQQARRPEAVDLLDPRPRLVADRRREVDHGVDPPQRLACDPRVRELAEVPERDPHLDPQAAELAGVAHEDPHLVAALEQLRDEGPAHGPGRASYQDHAGTL